MTTLATETWSATSTTAWPSQWTAGAAQGTASVASSRGRLTPSGTGYRAVRRLLTGVGATSAKRRITGTLIMQAVTESYPRVIGRETVGSTGVYPSGYYVTLSPANGSWVIRAGYGTGEYGDAAPVTMTMVAGNVYGYAVEVDGFTTSARLWNITAGQTEPTSWQSTWTDADSATASGVPGLAHGSGNTTNPYVEFGAVTVTDGATGVTSTAAASSVGAAAATSRLTAQSAATASGSGSANATTSTRSSSAATGSGAGSAQAQSQLNAAATGAATGDGSATATTQVAASATADAMGTGSATAETVATTTSAASASGMGAADAAAMLRTTGTAQASATGSVAATTTLQATSAGTASAEGSAAATTNAPGRSTADAIGTGSSTASTRLTASAPAAAVAFGTAAAIAILATRATAASSADGSASATTVVAAIATATADGAGSASATTVLPVPGTALDLSVSLTFTDRGGTFDGGTITAALSFPTRGGRLG